MGLLKKAATFTMLEIKGDLGPLKEMIQVIEEYPTPNIDGKSDEQAFSFSKINDVFEKGVVMGETVLGFGMRQDKKSISKSLLKKKMQEGMKNIKSDAKAKKQKITKEDKQLLKDNIMGEMFAEAKPIEKLVEVLWDTEKQVVYLGTSSKDIVGSFVSLILKVFPAAEIKQWNPLNPETKEDAEKKGTKECFQNAFFTWIFYETRVQTGKMWIPLNIKFLSDSAAVTIKGESDISLETYFAIYRSRFVDSLDLGYVFEEGKDKQEYEVSLSRGSWTIKNLKMKPEMVHEEVQSAVFERAKTFGEFVGRLVKLVKEFEEIRNNDNKDKKFWESLKVMASDHIKQELEGIS